MAFLATETFVWNQQFFLERASDPEKEPRVAIVTYCACDLHRPEYCVYEQASRTVNRKMGRTRPV
jgi:hypothetical protein